MHIFLAPLLLCASLSAMAFGDDLCFHASTGSLFNCIEHQDPCGPPNTSKSCKTQIALDVVDSASQAKHPRSMLHLDATFYLAQAVGIHYEAAHRIAAYNQVTDLGTYTPVNLRGNPLVDPALCKGSQQPVECKYLVKPMNGLVRTSIATGGSFFHYGALNNPKHMPVNGLAPLKNDPTIESMITNLRAWIFANTFLCTAGLNGPQTGTCYLKGNGKPGEIYGTIPTLEQDPRLDVQFKIIINEQIIHEDEEQLVLASQLESYVGKTETPDAKMGIYLHTLQDRISHHSCLDTTWLSAPSLTAGGNFVANYPREQCHQGIHLLWHTWETGSMQENVPASQRTLYAALEVSYDELLNYAQRKGWARPQASDPKYKTEVLWAIHNALQMPNPEKRLGNLMQSMDNFGYLRLPGH
jgi:hypothetical protein